MENHDASKSSDLFGLGLLLAIALGISIVNQWAIHYKNKSVTREVIRDVLAEMLPAKGSDQ